MAMPKDDGRRTDSLGSDHDRTSVLEFGSAHRPGAARGAAAQRLDRQLQLVAWLQGLARPSVAGQRARSTPFETPELGAAVRLLDLQDDERVRTSELELLHHAFELDRIFLIEHCERVMGQGGAARGDEGAAHQCSNEPLHGVSPFYNRFAGSRDEAEAP